MLRPSTTFLALLFSAILPMSSPAASTTLKAVASILPLHSLLAGVMSGVGEPGLLIPPGQSPHEVDLRPSQARALADADLVVWVGDELETGLRKSISVLGEHAHVLTLADQATLSPLPARALHDHHEHHEHGAHDIDPHLWLSPTKAKVIVTLMRDALSELDPDNAARFHANSATLQRRLDALDNELAERLAPVRAMPYLVFHDAYRYFEEHYGLHSLGAVTIDPQHAPGARRLVELRRKLHDSGARCIFTEPQFEPRVLHALTEGSTIRSGELDPIGADLQPGPDAYFQLMKQLGDALTSCLTDSSEVIHRGH